MFLQEEFVLFCSSRNTLERRVHHEDEEMQVYIILKRDFAFLKMTNLLFLFFSFYCYFYFSWERLPLYYFHIFYFCFCILFLFIIPLLLYVVTTPSCHVTSHFRICVRCLGHVYFVHQPSQSCFASTPTSLSHSASLQTQTSQIDFSSQQVRQQTTHPPPPPKLLFYTFPKFCLSSERKHTRSAPLQSARRPNNPSAAQ